MAIGPLFRSHCCLRLRNRNYSRAVTSSASLTPEIDAQAIALIRGLAMDAPLYAKSGHQGTAMALAPLAHVLYSRVLRHAPQQSQWRNRDRFILSNGHASILQYAMLFLNGYGLEIDDIKAFRQWDSQTPGHPEVGHTNGVEVTTGPLGQGFANAVGMAIAERNLRERFGQDLMDHHTFVLAGDGCFMEGISHEAASLAGHLGLDRLVCVFDDNGITIDGSTSLTCSDDVAKRFASYGWNVIQGGEIGEDLDALEAMLTSARKHTGQPTLCIVKTHIGYPSPDFTDAHEAHGNPFTAEHVSKTKAHMGIPDEPFWAPNDVVSQCRTHAANKGAALLSEYDSATAHAEGKHGFDQCWSEPQGDAVADLMPSFAQDSTLATRQAIQQCIEASASVLPGLLIGSADLTGNTGVKVKSVGAQSKQLPTGQQVYFGIREHAMGAAMVGMALHGGTIPVGGTFFVFADYMRPAIRLAALSKARVIFVFTHDSVGVGEDGPTHQPIEHLASLRVIPGLGHSTCRFKRDEGCLGVRTHLSGSNCTCAESPVIANHHRWRCSSLWSSDRCRVCEGTNCLGWNGQRGFCLCRCCKTIKGFRGGSKRRFNAIFRSIRDATFSVSRFCFSSQCSRPICGGWRDIWLVAVCRCKCWHRSIWSECTRINRDEQAWNFSSKCCGASSRTDE